MGLEIEPLQSHHDRQGFRCGVIALDDWLHKRAGQDERRHIARVFVLVEADAPSILGFYSLSSISIDLSALPESYGSRLPRYPEIPAALIGRLAVAVGRKGQGLGRLLLFDALQRLNRLSGEIACHAVIVDAKDETARRFYATFGFQPFREYNNRLFLPMKTVAKVVSELEA